MYKAANQNDCKDLGGVIWITGYSSAGKTTVARKVYINLLQQGYNAILLDGDDLRKVFGNKWGYSKNDRIELAKVYFRLCSHLSSQGYTVIISAVAMFKEVFYWVKTNIPRSLQIYLDVSLKERIKRDQLTQKNVYKNKKDNSLIYDKPTDFHIVLDNDMNVKVEDVANKICEMYFKSNSLVVADKGKSSYWNETYASNTGILEPSPFAIHIEKNYLINSDKVLEVGCGNGRDSIYFSNKGIKVKAIDTSEEAISLCNRIHNSKLVEFVNCSIGSLCGKEMNTYTVIYSRFVLHAMTVTEEDEMLSSAYKLLKTGGRLFIECRSINDKMARIGEVISPTERIYGHYRRFIILDELILKLKANGFKILEVDESTGLAVLGDEDPVVIRVIAEK